MSQQASKIGSAATDRGQPGMEVMPEVAELHSYEVNKSQPTFSQPRKPIPTYSINSIHEYSYQQSRKSRDNIIAFVIGFLCSMIVIGAVVGGCLGSRLASCQRSLSVSEVSKTASITPTPTASSSAMLDDYQVPGSSTINTLHNTCTDGTVTNSWGDQYATSCGKDFNNGFAAAEGGIYTDFASLVAYSFTDCLNACSGVNNKGQAHGFPTKCRSITFGLDMRNATQIQFSNCWLKNGTLKDPTRALINPIAMSAKLIS